MVTKPAALEADTMKAILWVRYGPPGDVLEFADMKKPLIAEDLVLVRVRAASVHIGDAHMIKGLPKAMRPIFAAIRRKNGVPGSDIAGIVEAVGANVKRFRPGDEVFGTCKGAFAEYVSASEGALAIKPANLSHEQASAIGTSAFTALQALRDHGKVKAGDKVLVTGASGGVGTFAIQIAKSMGAEVTGVCSARNLDMVRTLGADHVIDYAQDDFSQGDERYDVILDNIGNHSLSVTRRPLAPNGILLSNGAPVSGWFGGLGHLLKAAIVSLFRKQQGRPFVSFATEEDLATLRDLADAGKIVPVIDREYPLAQAPEAVAHVGEGHSQGKTISTIG